MTPLLPPMRTSYLDAPLLTEMYRQQQSGRDVDELYVDELDGVDGGDREGRRLLVGVVQLVKVSARFVQFESLEHGRGEEIGTYFMTDWAILSSPGSFGFTLCHSRGPTMVRYSVLMFWLCCRSLLAHWVNSCWADWPAQGAITEKQEEAKI